MSSHDDPLIGTLVSGRYRVIKPLGEGGMGQVYLAEHEAIEKKVALKVLKREYSEKPDIVVRFQQEAISASRIKHPNVLDVFDFGKLDNGCFFLSMEFLEGHDLAEELAQRRVISPEHGVRIALQIARALAAAHSRGVVHRDMKPENVFLQRTGDGEEIVKIVDFGIAQLRSKEEAAASEPKRRRLTRTGMIFGTPEYMAPEQAAGKKADLRVDIYAFGVILYEIFTGAVPFTGETFMAVLAAHLNDPAPPMASVAPDLKISPELQAVVMRALVKNPDQRFQSMSEMAAAILATPEGVGFGPMTRQGSLPDVTASAFQAQAVINAPAQPAPNQQTAAQFVSPSGTQAQFGGIDNSQAHPHAPTMVSVDPNRPSYGPPGAPVTTTGAQIADGVTNLGAEGQRVSTQLGAETTAPLPQKSRAGVFVLVAAVGLLGAGAAAYLVRGQVKPSAEPPAPSSVTAISAPQTSVEPAVTVAETPAPSAAPAPTASSAPAPVGKVTLQVVTEPPGAVLTKNGFQVCDTTPCEVLAAVDETIELEASKDKLKGKAKVLAQRDQKVTIKLAAAGGGGPAPGPKGPKMCEVDVDGLKILRPCP